MSIVSSPRVPISSPDPSRRRVPRPKDKRRALRDFYGIQQNNGPVKHDAQLDAPDFTVSSYLEQRDEKQDITSLLKLENSMIREIRVLDGERKSLLYDNYDRLINATSAIKKMTNEMEPLNRDPFEPILAAIADLTKDLHDDQSVANTSQQDSDAEDDPDVIMREWIRSGPRRINELLTHGETSTAKLELSDVEAETGLLEENEKDAFMTELNDFKTRIEAAQM